MRSGGASAISSQERKRRGFPPPRYQPTSWLALAGSRRSRKMAHDRKKSGARKDKKNERMREDEAWRHALAKPPHPSNDQGDIQTYKPGSAGDQNSHRLPG